MPEDFGWPLIITACAILGFQVALNMGLWLWLGKILGLLVRADHTEPLSSIVRRTADQMQVPYRAIWILRNPLGYAAAFPTTRDLIFSEGLIASHPEDEIAAICAHELAHLSEPRRTVYARVIGSMALYPLIFIRPMVHAFDFTGIAILLIPAVILAVFIRRLRRRMEVRADAMADKNAAEAGIYARALERLYRTNQMPAVMAGKRQIHPHLYDRMLSAGVTPDYPRPKAPGSLYWTTGFLYLVVIALITFLVAKSTEPDTRVTPDAARLQRAEIISTSQPHLRRDLLHVFIASDGEVHNAARHFIGAAIRLRPTPHSERRRELLFHPLA